MGIPCSWREKGDEIWCREVMGWAGRPLASSVEAEKDPLENDFLSG